MHNLLRQKSLSFFQLYNICNYLSPFLDFAKSLDDRVSDFIKINKQKTKSGVWCCNFCGIATHSIEDCPESKENGSNPRDPLGDKERCLQCSSYNHLIHECVHTEQKGSNRKGADGKKFQCKTCNSYDHMTQNCAKRHSEKYGGNKEGISGRKMSCDVCNSFDHLGKDHERSLIINSSVPCCTYCGEFSHSSANCHQVPNHSSSKLVINNSSSKFKWMPLAIEAEMGSCTACGASHHCWKTCPHRHEQKYGTNPRLNGVMVHCKTCESYNHETDDCYHGFRLGKNPVTSSGSKMTCMYCESYNHMSSACTRKHSERYGLNPRDKNGVKRRCNLCGSFSHLSDMCIHTNPKFSKNNMRCPFCGSYYHKSEKMCMEENDMIRDWLRRMLGYTNKIERNKWANMKSMNVSYVEEITEEEKEAQKESEKLR